MNVISPLGWLAIGIVLIVAIYALVCWLMAYFQADARYEAWAKKPYVEQFIDGRPE